MSTPVFGLGGTPAFSVPKFNTPQTTTSTTAPTTTQANNNNGVVPTQVSPSMTYKQLQDLVNKWTIEIEDQEKEFMELATKVNFWDKYLMANSEKLGKMTESMEKIKGDHERMENSLDFVRNYQKEFETHLEVLEATVPNQVSSTTPERADLYGLSEKLNGDLSQMSEDLKEVIRNINVSNKLDSNDPVSQILRILNEHTDTLVWIEEQSGAIKASLDEVTKMHQMFKKDTERNLRLAFHKP